MRFCNVITIAALVFISISLNQTVLCAETSSNFNSKTLKPANNKAVKACTGDEYIDFSKGIPFQPGFITDSPGMILGTTWYDYQTNGSTGNRIALCDDGSIYVSWMNAFNFPIPPRHIFHNWRDTFEIWSFADTGLLVDNRPHAEAAAGYTTLDIYQGNRGAAAYHYTYPSRVGRLAIDDADSIGFGYFDRYDMPNYIEGSPQDWGYCIWPYITVDINDRIHIVMTEATPEPGDSQRVIYTSSSDGGTSWTPLVVVDTINAISTICVSSKVSSKVSIVYTNPKDYSTQWNNDVYYIESLDGVNWDFSDKHDITNYSGSVRAYSDLDAIYDMNNDLHIIWSAPYYADGGMYTECQLWHWSQATGTDMIADGWWQSNPGAWNVSISKMSIGCDLNSNLFAVWSQFDNSDVANNGYSNGELYWAYSSNDGNNWTTAVNITNSATPGCYAGDCDSDHWSSLAEEVEEYLHIIYINDKDAGGIPQTEGTATENPVMYLTVENPLWPGAIVGTVFNQDSVPVENVYVIAGGTSVNDSTDINGEYTLDNLYAGSYNITFSHPIYQDTTVMGVAVTRGDTITLNVIIPYLPCDYYLPNCTFDSVLFGCPDGDVAYRIVLKDENNDPLENCSGFWLDFSTCDLDYHCPTTFDTYPLLFPVCPSNENGELFFYPPVGQINSGVVEVRTPFSLLYTIEEFRSFDTNGDTLVYFDDWTGGLENDYNLDGIVDWEDYDIFLQHLEHYCDVPINFRFARYMRSNPPSGYLHEGDTSIVTLTVTNNCSFACTVSTVKFNYSGFNIAYQNWTLFDIWSGSKPLAISQTDTFQAVFEVPSGNHGCLESWMFLESYTDSFRTQINLDSQGEHNDDTLGYSECEIEIGDQFGFPIHVILIANLPTDWTYSPFVEDTTFYDVGTLTITVTPAENAAPCESGSVTAVGFDADGNEIGSVTCEYIMPCGYEYLPGDANMFFGLWPPQCIGGDVTYLVNYFRGQSDNQPCELDDFWASADANGDCNIIGSDVTRLVEYFRGNTTLLFCPDYEPAWLTPDDLPPNAPSGWPNCETPVISKVIPSEAIER